MGFSVRIFIPTGEPEGLRVIEKSNWTGQGLFFPRAIYSAVSTREELQRTGVYILWGPSEAGPLERAYVGESDSLQQRLKSHQRDKDFWTHAVAFTSKDQNLNKAHVQYLESRLVQLADEAKRCELDNGNVPSPPSLSEPDKADAELFLADMLLCLPVLGVSFFEKPREPSRKPQDLFLRTKGIEARGYETAEGFVVRSGSQADRNETAGFRYYDLRRELLTQGILVNETDTTYKFAHDYIFNSPSVAAQIVAGAVRSGARKIWKDASGKTLREIQEAEVDDS